MLVNRDQIVQSQEGDVPTADITVVTTVVTNFLVEILPSPRNMVHQIRAQRIAQLLRLLDDLAIF